MNHVTYYYLGLAPTCDLITAILQSILRDTRADVHFRQWLGVSALKICTSYSGNLVSKFQQVLGHACNHWSWKSLTHNHSKRLDCWSVLSLRWCSVMAVHKCYAFRLKWINLLSPIPVVSAARCWPCVHSLGLVSRYSTVRSGTVTWCEWGLWTIPFGFEVKIRLR